MKKALGIDVGGTKIYSAIIDETGKIVSEVEKNPTPSTFEQIQQTFKSIIKKHEDNVDVIAFSTCGAVNNENTRILGSTGNIVKEYPKTNFLELSKKPVYVENDANCAAWAEHTVGASKGCSHSIMLTLGTGVGGGIIVENRLLKGQNGAAGEMHFKMYMDKRRKCTCGSWDCFEIYASGKGLKITAEEMLNVKDVTTYDIIAGVKNNNRKMIEILNRWQCDISDGIVGLANIFDPECVVLSGSMAEFVDVELIEKNVNSQIVTTPVKVRKATAGNFSGMIGAGILALEAISNGKI
jgi:glucokinase